MSDNHVLRTLRESAGFDPDSVLLVSQAADLIEQQAARIKELEAAFAQVNRNRESVDALKNQLAALRSKIENAEVVAWRYEVGGKVFNENQRLDNYHCDHNGDYVKGTPLIRKEDLK